MIRFRGWWASACWVAVWGCLGGAGGAESLLAPGAKVEKLAGGFAFTEGPKAGPDGGVYFTDIPNNRIHKRARDGAMSVHREDSGGGNGLAFDAAGNLLVCEGGRRRVVLLAPDGKTTVLADAYGGKKLNSPNDLWIDPQGGVYFTDPRYGRRDDLEQDGEHVYRISPDRRTVVRVCSDLIRPNGIVGTRDGKRLYVADHGAGKTWRYAIREDGTLEGKTLHVDLGSDGMALDERGNLYLTGRAVTVHDPEGKLLETIELPEGASNVCFGGKDLSTLFITAHTALYSVRLTVRGQ